MRSVKTVCQMQIFWWQKRFEPNAVKPNVAMTCWCLNRHLLHLVQHRKFYSCSAKLFQNVRNIYPESRTATECHTLTTTRQSEAKLKPQEVSISVPEPSAAWPLCKTPRNWLLRRGNVGKREAQTNVWSWCPPLWDAGDESPSTCQLGRATSWRTATRTVLDRKGGGHDVEFQGDPNIFGCGFNILERPPQDCRCGGPRVGPPSPRKSATKSLSLVHVSQFSNFNFVLGPAKP